MNRLLRSFGYQIVRADTLDRLMMGQEAAAEPPPAGHGVAYLCVIDHDLVLVAQCFIWLNCLTELHSVPCHDIFVHVPPGVAPAFVAWLQSRDVNVIPIEPFDPRNPYCYKIRQLDSFTSERHAQPILMDCDTAWIGEQPMPPGAPVRAKIVDLANPPEAVLRHVFHEASLDEPAWVDASLSPDRSRNE